MIDSGYDQEFEYQLKPKGGDSANQGNTNPAKVYCVYRWQYKSQNGAMYLHRRDTKPEKKTRRHIRLDPHWEFDYVQQVQDYLVNEH